MNTLISKAVQASGTCRELKSGFMLAKPDETSGGFEMCLLVSVDDKSDQNHSLTSASKTSASNPQGDVPVDLFRLQTPLWIVNPFGMESFAIMKQETGAATSEERLMATPGLYVAHEPDVQQPMKNALPPFGEERAPVLSLSPDLLMQQDNVPFPLQGDRRETLDLPKVPELENEAVSPIAIPGTPEPPDSSIIQVQAWQLTQNTGEAIPEEIPTLQMRETEPLLEAPKRLPAYHPNPTAASSSSIGGEMTTVPSPEGTGAVSTEPAPIFQQIADHLERLVRLPGEDSVRIQMDPPELGALDITVRVQGNEVQAQVSAEQDWTRRMIEQTIEQLRQMMEEQGLQLTQFDVHTGGAFQHRFAQDRLAPQDQQKEPANNTARSRVWDTNPLGQWSVWI